MSAVAGALRAAQRLRRGPLAALLGLPLLLALAAPAAAQTISFSSPDYPVWEGDAAKLDVVLSAPRTAATTMQIQVIPVTATGQGVDFIGERHTVTIPAGHPRATLTIRTVQDAREEDTESFRVTILGDGLPAGVHLDLSDANVHIQDDDQDAGSIPRLQIHRQGTLVPGLGMSYAVVEGNPADFLVTVSTDWASPEELAVSLKVSEDTSEGQDFVASGSEGAKTMTIHPWRDGAAKIYQVATATDSVREADGAVTVTLVPTDDYAVDPGHYQATVEVADNDEPLGLILQSSTPMFGGLTMAEGGGGGYTVRLASRPTSSVTVSVTARDDGDGDGDWSNVRVKSQSQSQSQSLSESQILSLTFTRDDWHIPQRIDVFSQSDAGYVNDRFSLVHTPSGGGYGSSETGYMRVGVVDNPPPPVPAQSVADNWALKPSGIGVGGRFRLLFLTAARNANASDIATYNSFAQTQAAGGHAAIQSYSSQFKAVGSTSGISARDNTNTNGAGDGIPIYWLNGDKIADDYNDFWDGSWDAQMASDTRKADGMAEPSALQHWTGTDTNGSAHGNALGSGNVRHGAWGSGKNPISDGTVSGGGNKRMLALSPVFEVSSGSSLLDSDSIGLGDSTDSVEDDGGTETDNAPKLADYSELKAKVRTWAGEQDANSDHAQRWNRVLAALGDQDAIEDGYSPMTAAEAQTHADKGWTRWDDVVAALTEVESRAAAETRAEPEPEPPPPEPELSLSAGSAVDEGTSATFTLHANPAPASDVTVSVTVAQSGDWLASPGAGTRGVTLAAGATAAGIDVATVNDNTDEPDGSVSLTLATGTGYTVASSPNDTATVAVRDDDDPPPPPPAIAQGACVSVAQWNTVKGYYDSNANRSPNYGANWYRVLIAYRQDRGDQALPAWVGQTAEPTAAYTVKEAEDGEAVWSGWTPVREILQCLKKTYGGGSTDSAVGGVPPMGQSGEVGTGNPGEAMERDRWNPQTDPAGFEPDAMTDFAAGACVSPRLRSDAAARASETWRGPAHVEHWLRVAQTFSGGANDATVVTPAEANFHAAAGQPGWLPVADALRCLERQSLREALSR